MGIKWEILFHSFTVCLAYNKCTVMVVMMMRLYSESQGSEWRSLCLTLCLPLMGLQRQGNIFIKTLVGFIENWTVLTLESYLFIAISWSAVPEQPLDVTASGFPQGTTKKGIRNLQARYNTLGQKEMAIPTTSSRTFHHPKKKTLNLLRVTPTLPSPHFWQPLISIVSTDLSILDVSYK